MLLSSRENVPMPEEPRNPATHEQPPQGPDWVWFHIILTAYGAWLEGDARGFRTRHHREHVDGDYKNPPPLGKYADREARSRRLLKQEPVEWTPSGRGMVGSALVSRFQKLGAFVLCAAVARQHVHLLVKLPRAQARRWSGLAKKHAWFVARERGWTTKMWGKRGKQSPIKDRRHQLNVYHYIMNHAEEGAWVWCWKRNT
jgi:hypothetical protein